MIKSSIKSNGSSFRKRTSPCYTISIDTHHTTMDGPLVPPHHSQDIFQFNGSVFCKPSSVSHYLIHDAVNEKKNPKMVHFFLTQPS